MIGVPKAAALSRLGLRLKERRSRLSDDNSPLTQEDEDNIADFEGMLSQTLSVLQRENDALEASDIEGVAACFEEKARLLERLETRQPAVEPFLKIDAPSVAPLRTLIRDLASQLEINERLLRGMAEASRSIKAEIEHLRERQSLKGVYTAKGQLQENLKPKSTGRGFERKI